MQLKSYLKTAIQVKYYFSTLYEHFTLKIKLLLEKKSTEVRTSHVWWDICWWMEIVVSSNLSLKVTENYCIQKKKNLSIISWQSCLS